MGWFTKKEKIPELPPYAKLSETQVSKSNLPELPSFNNAPVNEQLNNEVIKSAVQDSSGENEANVEELPQDFHFPVPEPESKPEEARKTFEMAPEIPKNPSVKSTEPIFVRIDKFHDAKKDFEEIKRKLKEIDSVLKKVKDIKVKEDEELSGWSGEVEKIKSRISEIDESFFNKM